MIVATPCMGVNMPLSHLAVEMECVGSAIPDLVGEAVTSTIDEAYKANIDVGDPDFIVIVSFKGKLLAKKEEHLQIVKG